MGWLIALAAIILLGCIPVGVNLVYGSGGALVDLLLGPIRITLYPRKTNHTKSKSRKNMRDVQKDDFESRESREKKTDRIPSDYLSALEFVLEVLSDFRRKLRINRLDVKWTLSGDDPCDLSINYGRVCAAIGSMMPQLDRLLVIKERNVKIGCDYMAQKDVFDARLELSITLGRLLFIFGYHGIRGLRKYYKLTNQIKGGAVT